MRVYLAGRIRGVRNYQMVFANAAQKLRQQGHSVFNPAAAGLDDGRPLWKIMAYLLPQLCECEGIALIPAWWRSGGARIEWLLARYLGKKVIRL